MQALPDFDIRRGFLGPQEEIFPQRHILEKLRVLIGIGDF